MLGSFKVLNTSIINLYSENFKDITISNQQVNIKNVLLNFLYNLRDYTRGVILFIWLRYSPIFLKNMKLYTHNFILVNKKWFNLCPHQERKISIMPDHNLNKLDPNWVTGFTDAEGCFSIIIDNSYNIKGKIRISFEINLHEKDKDILYKIQDFFGIGAIYHRSDRKKSVYRVTNVNYIKNVIIPHFINYPLVSKKAIDFSLWSEAIKLILNKEHLTKQGFMQILSLYASINRGMSKKASQTYPDVIPAPRPLISLPDNLNPQWVSGFVAGDGGFSIYVRSTEDYASGKKVYCRFHIAQHSKDLELMKLFIKFFNCGTVSERSNITTLRCDYIVQDVNNIVEKILPHFDKYPVLNLKQEDYKCFKECITIIKLKQHLEPEGLNKIINLNLEMNSNRLKN